MGDRVRNQRTAVRHTLSRLGLQNSDDHLVARAVRGDEVAFAEFYDRYATVAYGLALRVLREPTLAATVVQDAFVSFARADGATVSAGSGARTRLLRLVHRKAVEALHARPDTARTPPTLGEEAAEQTTLAATSEHHRCTRALAQLPEDQRQTLELSYYGGLCIDELARRVGQSRGEVCKTLHAGLFRLQKVIEGPATVPSAEAPDAEPARPPHSEPRPRRTGSFFRERDSGSGLAVGDGDNDRGR